MKKYKMFESDLAPIPGFTKLTRIVALKDFGDVKKGDLGGFIEKESNLSQEGSCWVYDEASVTGNAKVSGSAKISGGAEVRGNAIVKGKADVSGDTLVFGEAVVDRDTIVKNGVIVTRTSTGLSPGFALSIFLVLLLML